MGGKSQDNSAMINEQKAQAEEARQKETARQGRLAQGLAGIKAAFEGAPKMGKRAGNYDWSNFNTATSGSGDAQTQALGAMFGSNFVNALKRNAGAGAAVGQQVQGLPAGYTVVQIPGTTTAGTPAVAARYATNTSSGSPSGGGGNTGAAVQSPYYNNNRQGPQPFVTVTNPSGGGRGEGGGGSSRIKILNPAVKPAAPQPTSQAPYNNSGGGRGEGGSGNTSILPHNQQLLEEARAAVPGTTGPATWGIRGPDGRIYKPGEAIGTEVEYDTGERSGGFGDSFFNKFRQGIVDYYMPQVANQYKDAQDQTTYGLARAGTLKSSTAVDEVKKLAEQNALNRADVLTKADTGAADLRTRVAAERAKAESQLYATEDPTTAVNQALAAVKNISLAQPEMTPLADVFKVAALGGANAMTGYQNERMRQTIPGYQTRTTKVVNG